MSVTIQNSQSIPYWFEKLLQAANRALEAEGAPDADVSVVLTDDETIHDLNYRYRGYDKPTDVLSFAQRDQHPEDDGRRTADDGFKRSKIQNPESQIQAGSRHELLGDVVISVETAARQADTHGMSLDEELALLVTHGILHLLGYDDVTEEGVWEMEAKERALGVRP